MKTFLIFSALVISTLGTNFSGQYYANTADKTTTASNFISSCGIHVKPGMEFTGIYIGDSKVIADPSKLTITLEIQSTNTGAVGVDVITPDGRVISLIRRIGANDETSCGSTDSLNLKLQ